MSDKSSYTNARIILLSEYLFIFLPFVVIGIIKIYTSDLDSFFKAADWSFAASILFGQVLVKLVSGSVIHQKAKWQRVVLLFSLVLVLGLVPCLITLALILIDNGASLFLVYLQTTLFCIATIVFFWLGSASHVMLEEG
ncbi:hypothetical protein ACU5DF_02185 [Aliivibrio wodanis]|uniref:hypothetical protein n=1 Tax=Aliivibrio wodanis TaxID=80852 RepID=UPI00076AD5C9